MSMVSVCLVDFSCMPVCVIFHATLFFMFFDYLSMFVAVARACK